MVDGFKLKRKRECSLRESLYRVQTSQGEPVRHALWTLVPSQAAILAQPAQYLDSSGATRRQSFRIRAQDVKHVIFSAQSMQRFRELQLESE